MALRKLTNLNVEDINGNFNEIESLINKANELLSFVSTIKVTDTFDASGLSADEIVSKFTSHWNVLNNYNAIAIGALPVGTSTFEFLGKTIKTGDILIRTPNGQPIQINGLIPKIYEPTIAEGGESITWTLKDESEVEESIDWDYELGTDDSHVYQYIDFNDVSRDAETVVPSVLNSMKWSVLRFYTANNEEVLLPTEYYECDNVKVEWLEDIPDLIAYAIWTMEES